MRAALADDEFHELIMRLGGLDDRVAEELTNANLSTAVAPLPAILAPYDWDFVGAAFFCFTAATTIGCSRAELEPAGSHARRWLVCRPRACAPRSADGNYTPQTSAGKTFLVFYACVAIPACLSAFSQISDRALEVLARRFRRRMIFEKRIRQAFDMFDADRSGKLDRAEVRNAMRVLGYRLDESSELGVALNERFEHGFTACDPDGDNALDLHEFRSFVQTVAPDAAVKVELVLSKGYVVLLATAIFFAIVGLSTLAFSAFYEREAWSALDAFYFTIVTFTTIGFGDFSPDPHPGWFAAVFIVVTFFGLGITATLVRAASDPAFDLVATARGLAPRHWDAFLAARDAALVKVVDVFGLPTAWKPQVRPALTSRADLHVAPPLAGACSGDAADAGNAAPLDAMAAGPSAASLVEPDSKGTSAAVRATPAAEVAMRSLVGENVANV
jgi:hypothetical protein